MKENEVSGSRLCPSCFSELEKPGPCTSCGFDGGEENWNRLKPGTMINGRYIVGRVLGQGGFGITYLALDSLLGLKLAVKEYFPSGAAVRHIGDRTVMSAGADVRADFQRGMDKFLEEARVLARFEGQPNIVSVRDFFQENGTAYMVMAFLEGRTLLKYLEERGGRISFEEALETLAPVMDALDEVHASGLIHRDISPDNIFVTQGCQVKLLDFGASKSALHLMQQKSHSIVLKRGYSPPEQYQSKGNMGPWTDVYGMAATLFRCVTGAAPPDSLDRLGEDASVFCGELKRLFPGEAAKGMMLGLSLSPGERPQSMREFKEKLRGNIIGDSPTEPVPPREERPEVFSKAGETKKGPGFGIVLLAGLAIIGAFLFFSGDSSSTKVQKTAPPPAPSSRPVSTPAPDTARTRQAAPPEKELNADSLFALGMQHYNGIGVEQDSTKAAHYFSRAAEMNSPHAQTALGLMYMSGAGVRQNYFKAADLMERAAGQGFLRAQSMLAQMYEKGQGVTKDVSKAMVWYKKAADQGDQEAGEALRRLASSGAGLEIPKLPKTSVAKVSATQVIMRTTPSIHSGREGMLNKGEILMATARWVSDKDNEGILKNDVSTSSGYVLKKGRAVSIRNYNPNSEAYEVTIQDSKGDVSGWIDTGNVKSLKGNPWYRVIKQDGKSGWVLGEYLHLENPYLEPPDSEDFSARGAAKNFLPFFQKYCMAMDRAVNSGLLGPVLPFLNPEGPLKEDLEKVIKTLKSAGIKQELQEVEITRVNLEGGEMVLFVNEEYNHLQSGSRPQRVFKSYRYRIRRSMGEKDDSGRILYSRAEFSRN